MAEKKLTTAEILAKLRNQDGGGDSVPAESPAAETQAGTPDVPVEESAAAEDVVEAAPKPPAAKPSSTADILAAARAQKAGGASAGGDAPKPKPAGGKPKSTSDILAAARAQKAGGADGGLKTPAAAVSKPAAAKKAVAPPVGDRPSVSEMVKAAREGKPMPGEAPPPRPKLPARPALPKAKKAADDPDRRGFLVSAITTLCTPYYLAWGVLSLIGAVWSLAVARFMMPNMIVEPPTSFKIGPPSDYPMGNVSTKWKAERGIWVVHTDQYDGRNLVYALASVCTHLGCTPNWLAGEQKYKCPCHGSGFRMTGINFEGPAPRPLERVGLRLAEDGSLEVDKSVKFQEELGQWQDPASFVELA